MNVASLRLQLRDRLLLVIRVAMLSRCSPLATPIARAAQGRPRREVADGREARLAGLSPNALPCNFLSLGA
jgi:hypothetical protein